jgi:hypothetical protein
MEKTRLSNKGQVVVGDGIKLKPMKPYKETKIEEVIGCVGYKGPKKSLKDMEAAIAKGARENI